MCNKHLLGEHVEHHMFVGSINKHKSIKGFIENNLLEPKSLITRHDEIVKEMKSRGMNHKSDLPEIDWDYLESTGFLNHKIDIKKSEIDLFSRCEECKKQKLRIKNNV
jgi:hypothetical protein